MSSTEALLLAPGGVAVNVYVTGSDVGAGVPAMDLVEYSMLMMYVPGVAIVKLAPVLAPFTVPTV